MNDEKLNTLIIKCPHCEQEYFAGELFVPNALIGQPKEIDRDIAGNIVEWEGTDPCLEETYICDKCGTKFKIHANISFKTEQVIESLDSYESAKYSDRLFLKED